ncbi:MAG TPA: thioredoxin domain-containing protein [Candidatus Angelobacter sp.]|nr:thioredoxin domain-containing protein [Candidatus Angelobacter sp.]
MTVILLRIRPAFLSLLLVSLVISIFLGCRNLRTTPTLDARTDRQIELTIRSQYDIPADYGVAFGRARASNVPGYDELPVTFSHGDKHVDFAFLLSHDRRWLARLQKLDLHEDLSGGIDIDGRPLRGNPEAKVTVVVYDDLQCPFCSRFNQEVIPQTIEHYKGRIRVVYKDYPLSEVHSWATHAAVNADCLAEQDAIGYWKYIDNIHGNYKEFKADPKDLANTFKKLDDLVLLDSAGSAANATKLHACVKAQNESYIKRSIEEADRLNVQSTPTIYVNGERIVGFRPKEWLWAAIDRALSADSQKSATP